MLVDSGWVDVVIELVEWLCVLLEFVLDDYVVWLGLVGLVLLEMDEVMWWCVIDMMCVVFELYVYGVEVCFDVVCWFVMVCVLFV